MGPRGLRARGGGRRGGGTDGGGISAASEHPAPLSLQVGTNGVISTQDFPRETQYVDDDFPTDFPVVAPFLADLDTSGDRGNIYYRQDDSPAVLGQAAGYIQAGFPRTAGAFMPTNAFIATWEDVGAYQELSQDAEPSKKLNTFQAVIAYDDEDTYAIFLYPDGGLQFLGTRPKESYNVQLELPARVGFSWGDGDDPKRDGLFHSLASSEQALRQLERESNVGVPGVWVFHVGSAEHVEPGVPPVPSVPQSPPHRGPGTADYTHHVSTQLPAHRGSEATSSRPHQRGIVPQGLPPSPGQERSRRLYPDGDGGAWQSYSANPSSYSSGHHGVGVEEDVHFNPDVFTYSAASKETCAQHHGTCSPHAFCTDYATGFCCHCRATYYGNGRQCLPEGAVHRLNGKVSGSLTVGRASVRFQEVDLHAYIVGSDGRAYTAISGVPQPATRALLPLLPIGGLFAWLFALEEPGSENGFSITGAEFTQSLEVTFYPGEEKVHITQTAEGLGPDNYLSLKTHIQGEVPFLPENVTVHIGPYKELYHYSSSAVMSSAHREYVLAAGTANQTLSYRLHQNISFTGCPHARPPARQQLSVARAFALYDGQEHVLRYALAARVGSASDDVQNPLVNPCHDGTHACEAPARCQPGVGTEYTCECAAGYRPDGRGCRDVDECTEGLSRCSPFTLCLNVPGSYRCECRSGYRPAQDGQACVPLAPPPDPCEDGRNPCAPRDRARCLPRAGGHPACQCLPGYSGDGIHCADVDECAENPCHPAATCYNTPGSFSCRCQPGYEGDGFQCTHAEGGTQRLTPCQHQQLYPREVPPGPSPVGDGHVPQCDEEGQYRPLQCHGSSGHCWCVDAAGQEIAGTRTAPGSTPPRCGNPEAIQQLTPCEHERLYPRAVPPGPSPVGDGHVPQCDEEGRYRPLQCHGSSGHCWCVDAAGQEIAGTRTAPGSTPPRCGNPGGTQRLTPCQHQQLYPRAVPPGPSLVGDGHVPQCDEEGQYRPLQCHGSSGHCWCVDAAGQEIAGTRTAPGSTPPRCGNPEAIQQLTPCEHERLYPRAVPPGPSPVGDGHVPQCDEEGRYRPLQCHGSSGHCWCVDAAGQEIAGTRTAPGSTPPRCGNPAPTERPQSMCERWRQSLLEHYGGSPRHDQYVPQCQPGGEFTPLQCHGDSGYCWCVDESGREIQGTRSEPGTTPPCLPSVAPPSVRPSPRPDVSPPTAGTFLLYAQGQQIGYLPLNGTRLQKEEAKTLLSLHGSIVVGIDYDCREKTIYWTDVAGRTISRASLEPGAEPETIINSGLMSPEGLAVDHLRRAMFWTDSGLDKIERARLDGSERRVLFDTELVNPRAIAVDPVRGNLYWTDWNREAPKIETSTVNGANRRVLVNKDIGLPNGLTFDPFSKLLCWADAGTKHLECTFPDGTGRRVVQNNLNYPFSIISYANHFYHTDWRRDGVIAIDKETGSFTDEYLPEQRSHLYGITAVYPYCPGARK
ncbi:PREDICTED: nidogen-2 [Calidris pugnax]|uniref:nidogen-2 n=1 Tax=Calidris pugnax TaxID=198806 RepID=UPI00071CBEE2|nr:PREDICTED: nidogen-2 [Calidris pugnax]